ncbi:MAG: exodeoxyribonuclease small subunit [Candidatus Binatota bacterium]|jgi:exodeoxyribonuclease VII small subunit|nr:exodeoxyribonuclease small subunit [Candidatus Binatota bacterium]
MKFEDRLRELEGVVDRLESGQLALEEALAAFEKGVGLVRELTRELDEVERRLEILTRNTQGELELREAEERRRGD